jgi:AcrR family transcriptional regulator
MAVKSVRGSHRKELILATALELFRKQGYEQTTMRAIAEAAGASLGNAYYYFPSKEHLVLAFYEQTGEDQRKLALPIIERTKSLKNCLIAVIRSNLCVIEPHHRFFANLFSKAGDPRSPLNPFGKDSETIRSRAIEIFETMVAHCNDGIAQDLRVELPTLLWLYYMGIVLFWLHDRSFGRRKTNQLLESSAHLVVTLVSMSRLPLMNGWRRAALNLLKELKEDT